MGPTHRKMHSNGRFELKPPASWWCDHPAKLGHHQLLSLRFNSPKQSPPQKKKLDVGNLDFLSSLNQNRIQPPVLSARRFQCSCREEFQTSRSKDPNEFSQSDLSRQMKGPCAMAFHSFFMVCRATFFTRILTHLCVCTICCCKSTRSTQVYQEFAWILDEANLPSSRAASVQRCWSPPPSQHGPAYRLLGTLERTIVNSPRKLAPENTDASGSNSILV